MARLPKLNDFTLSQLEKLHTRIDWEISKRKCKARELKQKNCKPHDWVCMGHGYHGSSAGVPFYECSKCELNAEGGEINGL